MVEVEIIARRFDIEVKIEDNCTIVGAEEETLFCHSHRYGMEADHVI